MLAWLAVGVSCFGAVSGTVVNQTSGRPQSGVTVTLYKLGSAGPESLETVKSGADGRFEMAGEASGGPHMVQTAHQAATYNVMLFPGRPATGLNVEVYDSSARAGAAKVTTHMILVEPNGSEATVNESVIWNNPGKLTFFDPKGTFRFHLPAAVKGRVAVMCTHPAQGGVPIERAADKTDTRGIFTVDWPVKPGETRFDFTYTIPLADGGTLAGRTVHGGGPVRMVAPAGVTLAGEAVEMIGQEPSTQAAVYEVKKADYKVEIRGTGALRGLAAAAEEQEEGVGLRQIRPPVYDRFPWILGLAGVILVTGMALLYRKQA